MNRSSSDRATSPTSPSIKSDVLCTAADAIGDAVVSKLRAIVTPTDRPMPNYFRAMQDLLRKYKGLKALVAAEDEYLLLRDHDKSVASAPRNKSASCPIDAWEQRLDAKAESYVRTLTQFDALDHVVQMVSGRPEFVIVRMYYFGEDYSGNDRPPRDRPYTFLDLQCDLEDAGIQLSRKTIQRWHSTIIRDMVTLLWGIDGAVSLQTPSNNRHS